MEENTLVKSSFSATIHARILAVAVLIGDNGGRIATQTFRAIRMPGYRPRRAFLFGTRKFGS
jgi:hypothetical protein